MRLIRALQKGYVEALEAGDWQAADYRCTHLNKLCEGLYYLSQLLDRENSLPDAVASKPPNGWVNSIRSVSPNQSSAQALGGTDKPAISPPPISDPTRYEWGGGLQVKKPPIDEVWE
jgi:hypothetical protein